MTATAGPAQTPWRLSRSLAPLCWAVGLPTAALAGEVSLAIFVAVPGLATLLGLGAAPLVLALTHALARSRWAHAEATATLEGSTLVVTRGGARLVLALEGATMQRLDRLAPSGARVGRELVVQGSELLRLVSERGAPTSRGRRARPWDALATWHVEAPVDEIARALAAAGATDVSTRTSQAHAEPALYRAASSPAPDAIVTLRTTREPGWKKPLPLLPLIVSVFLLSQVDAVVAALRLPPPAAPFLGIHALLAALPVALWVGSIGRSTRRLVARGRSLVLEAGDGQPREELGEVLGATAHPMVRGRSALVCGTVLSIRVRGRSEPLLIGAARWPTGATAAGAGVHERRVTLRADPADLAWLEGWATGVHAP